MYIKFDGSTFVSTLFNPSGSVEPTLSGLGIMKASGSLDIPPPNSIFVVLSGFILVVNLREDFFNRKMYGAVSCTIPNQNHSCLLYTSPSKRD